MLLTEPRAQRKLSSISTQQPVSTFVCVLTRLCWSFTAASTVPSGPFLKTVALKLPRLLDDERPGRMGLLHRRAHLTVPHAHWRLWKVVAQL